MVIKKFFIIATERMLILTKMQNFSLQAHKQISKTYLYNNNEKSITIYI